MSKAVITVEPARHDIVMTREFDAPRELVFKAYTDPAAIPQWWGPRRLRTTVERMDVRPGGGWRFVQRDTDGSEYAFHGVYHEIAPPERLVQTFEFEGAPGHVVLETVTFEDLGGRTRLTTTSVFQTAADRDGMLTSGAEQGMAEGMDRLEELLRGRDRQFDALVGEWALESPQFPGGRGRASFRWMEEGAYLLWRSEAPEPAPTSVWIIGSDGPSVPGTALYHDTRGVSRVYRTSLVDGVWKVWREAPGFWQRFTGTIDADGATIRGAWEGSKDGSTWEHDFDLVFTRR